MQGFLQEFHLGAGLFCGDGETLKIQRDATKKLSLPIQRHFFS